MSDELFAALDRLVPECSGERGDWAAVVDAAGSTEQKPRWLRITRPRALAACIAVAAATVVSVTPAFGLREFVLDLVGGRTSVVFAKSAPAPPEIKRQFLEIAVGAPAGMNPHVLPGEARQITFRNASPRNRVMWVAPTTDGGFCSVGGINGGCLSKSTETSDGAVTINAGFSIADRRGATPRVIDVGGYVFSPRVDTLTLEFADRRSSELPFVFVSSPIDAGFYGYSIPAGQQQRGHWPTRIVARDKQGVVIGTAQLRLPTAQLPRFRPQPGAFKRQRPRALPLASTVHPTAPTQTATVDGVTVVAGANGAVQFTGHGLPTRVSRLLGRNVSISCFRLTREFGLFTVLGLGTSGAFADSMGYHLSGVGHPLDGCDVESSGGHRWPDGLGSHSPVELAFTAKGRAFFADRAAARDLALFVRSGRMQKIRHEPGAQLVPDMKAAYGAELAKSRIRYRPTADGITFTERSPTGKVFRVVVRHGRIAASNLSQYAFVH